MELEKIITLANAKVRLPFLAMERSLRNTGCKLPIWVIPYDDNRFPLPENCVWWEEKMFFAWLQNHAVSKLTRKYICLTQGNYHFLDTDIILLKDPVKVLMEKQGFITSCGHWQNPAQTYTPESIVVLARKSTLWQKYVFNSGQFACDRVLYQEEEMKQKCQEAGFSQTCLTFTHTKHEQPALNLLVNASGVPIENLTLPPEEMESTWAGDYPGEHFNRLWQDEKRKPYLIHWAGLICDNSRPIDYLFYNYLTRSEKQEWQETLKRKKQPYPPKYGPFQPLAVKLKQFLNGL